MKEIGTDPSTPCAFHTPRPSLGHRDMGTQMTPAESQRNSMCTTPKFVTSPENNSPACLGTPSGTGPMGGTVVPGLSDLLQLKSCHLAKLELHKLANDAHPMIDRNPTWNTEQDDKLEHTTKLCQYDLEGGILVSKATAWKQVELAKCTTRYFKSPTQCLHDDEIKSTIERIKRICVPKSLSGICKLRWITF